MILKGRIFHFLDKGNIDNPENSFEYIEKGGLVISGEKIIDIGEFNQIILQYPNSVHILYYLQLLNCTKRHHQKS